MGYPLVFAYKGDEFARINYDGTWSVLWNKANIVRSEPSTLDPNNRAIVACATALMAAKDNFYLTPWETSNSWADKWDGKTIAIDIDTVVNETHLIMRFNGEIIIQVNHDGSWSLDWDLVKKAYDENSNKKTASFCQMLLAGRYNFVVAPWPGSEPDDDDDF